MDVVINSFVIFLYFIFCKKKKEEERLGGRKQRYIYSYILKFNIYVRCIKI